jgi:hypothetical protein
MANSPNECGKRFTAVQMPAQGVMYTFYLAGTQVEELDYAF